MCFHVFVENERIKQFVKRQKALINNYIVFNTRSDNRSEFFNQRNDDKRI